MDVSLEEIRQLRSLLTAHRLKHELLVTQMQVLREESRQARGTSALDPALADAELQPDATVA